MNKAINTHSTGTKVLSGNYAAAYGAKLSQVEVVSFYPITPATSMLEKVAEFVFKGEMKAHVVMAEGEHSAMSLMIGASMAGARCFSGSSGQGMAYMHEPLQAAGRGRYPMVLVNCSRGLYHGSNNEHPEHDDSLTVRDSGWVQLFCESSQEVLTRPASWTEEPPETSSDEPLRTTMEPPACKVRLPPAVVSWAAVRWMRPARPVTSPSGVPIQNFPL